MQANAGKAVSGGGGGGGKCATRGPNDGRGEAREPITLRQLLGPVSGLGRSLGQIFLLAFALEAFLLLSPFLMQWVVDDVVVSGDRDLLLTLVIGFGLLVLIVQGSRGMTAPLTAPVTAGTSADATEMPSATTTLRRDAVPRPDPVLPSAIVRLP